MDDPRPQRVPRTDGNSSYTALCVITAVSGGVGLVVVIGTGSPIGGAMVYLAIVLGGSVDAQAAERSFINATGGPVKSTCDASMTHGSCFYDGVESQSDYLVVKLGTPGGMNADALANAAGRHWFNFIHCDYPELKTIVVRVNGVDHNVFHSDTGADRMPC